MSRNLKPEDLNGLLHRLKERLDPLLPKDEVPIMILDTTGIAHRGLTQNLRYKKGRGSVRLGAKADLGFLPDAILS